MSRVKKSVLQVLGQDDREFKQGEILLVKDELVVANTWSFNQG
jgi:hypothetical protein